jgi:DNA-binding NtrC family response regulator/tetratricopeptide (TPR) repeat protein
LANPAHPLGGALQERAEVFGFGELDERVRTLGSHGVLVARVATEDDAKSLAQHLIRRAKSAGRRAVRASLCVESTWRDAALRLGVSPLPSDAVEAARTLAARASSLNALVVAGISSAACWDVEVAKAIEEHANNALFVITVVGDALPGAISFTIPSELGSDGLARWWEAALAAHGEQHGSRLSKLEGWLDSAATVTARRVPAELSADATALWRRLSVVGRAWPVSLLSELGEASGLGELEQHGLVEVRDQLVTISTPAHSSVASVASAEAEDLDVAAKALLATQAGDPWACMRVAELVCQTGDLARAEPTALRAFELTADGESRLELWARWRAALARVPGSSGAILRGAERALEMGDVDVALSWAEQASSGDAPSRAAFVLGRAALSRGDLVSATAALGRAKTLATSREEELSATVQIAEVLYAKGDLDQAAELANQVLQEPAHAAIRLTARNLLGKLLLARGEWMAADSHFAEDECEAVGQGDSVARLRARVNRAVSMMSRGSWDEAGALLGEVLHEAETQGEWRAVGFALSNLAALATDRHDYVRALALLERSIAIHRRRGERLLLARAITNLAELRLRVGLVDQAEHALRFGRQVLAPGAPASRLAEIAVAAAQVHLARHRTLDAEKEIRAALRSAAQSSDGDKLGEAHRLAARIALEDGVVPRAEVEIARAKELASSQLDRAEVALIEARIARAAGRSANALAELAVVAARESGEEEVTREAHVLAAECALSDEDLEVARSHLVQATTLRDEILSTLTGSIREAYLARPELMRLARLDRIVAGSEDAPSSPLSVDSLPPPRVVSNGARYVGRHLSVRALLDSVQRVGRTGATVLIHGESGTGKELVAELLHSASDRSAGPLVKVNCAALVESLLLSELFGHEKGAFTGANARRRGRFERANGGTLFLDEIGDISPRTQVALLRVLEERRFERVGGSASIEVDVRIVCATHRDLSAMVERGEFREDLYYRLSGISLEVPALRERVSDLPALCDAILLRVAEERGDDLPKTLSPEALELLARHRWPGNVRELENALRAGSVMSDGEVVDVADLVEHVDSLRKLAAEPAPLSRAGREPTLSRPPPAGAEGRTDDEVTGVAYAEIKNGGVSLSDLKRNIERECIARALEETGGNITRAATLLGMKRPRLSQLVKQYGFLTNTTEEP